MSGIKWIGATAAVIGAALAALTPAGARGVTPAASCAPGSAPAVVAGRHACLRSGQACRPGLDTRYHLYRFHCHTGRLVRMSVAPAPPAPRPQLPGQRVDVGGYSLYIECVGSGSPTVVFESGEGGAAATSPLPAAVGVRREIASETRVCAYDRAGLGASEPRPAGAAPTGTQYANELHALLAGANVPGPYVLVGPAFGGLISAAYASEFPAETAGLVFLDADTCEQTCAYDFPEPGRFDLGSVSFGNRPTAVLVAEYGFGTGGRGLGTRSTNRIVVTALASGHAIIEDKPQLVTEAIRLVVAAARTGASLPGCDQTSVPAAGGRCEATG